MWDADVAELVYAHDWGSCPARGGGSSPLVRTRVQAIVLRFFEGFESCPRHQVTIHKLDTKIYVGQKALIRKGNKVLVLRDPKYAKNGQKGLDFPGGKYRFGLDLEKELYREVAEETGLKVKRGKPFFTWINKSSHYKTEADVYLVGFVCKYISGEVRLSDEHDKFEWVDKKSYTKWKEDSDYYSALKEYFKQSGT